MLWQIFWLNVYLPGHTRGAITLPGLSCAASKASCCDSSEPQDGAPPTQEQKQRCAVCYFAAGYTVPPIYSFDLGMTGAAVERVELFQAQVQIIEFAFPFYPAGPPGIG